MSSNWRSWFHGSTRRSELQETLALLRRAQAAGASSGLEGPEEVHLFIVGLIFDICERRGIAPSLPLGRALYDALHGLIVLEALVVPLPDPSSIEQLTLEESVDLRDTLRRRIRMAGDLDRLLPIWREKVVWAFSGMLEYFPLSAFADFDEEGKSADDSVVLPEAPVYELCDNLPEVVDRLLITLFDRDVVSAGVFDPIRRQFNRNARLASGIAAQDQTKDDKIKLPSEQKDRSPQFLANAYLQGTPFLSFFAATLPFAIPFPVRFEHTHVLGGTGHGKTQLLQFLIHHDIVRSIEDGRSIVVIDSQGDLIRTVSKLAYFDPGSAQTLADRFVLVDPNDVEYPVCLNMFDFKRDRLSKYDPLNREKILNATIELYEYFFGALLGAELTQRQGVVFKYLARLLLEIPEATIHTLRELMEDGERFRPYMEKLTGTARAFFETRFFDRQFTETKKQILARLWGVLANACLERMFSHTRSNVDLFELMNSGKIIFINTAKDLLGQEGAAIFGRFFIALISQATVQRAAQLPHERRSTFVYIDEAQDYFDENISNLLNQARKYHVGLVFAHQNMDQLTPGLRASVLSSTSIKFAGGLSAKDAGLLDVEFRRNSEFLLAQRKDRQHTTFACHVRNYTERALSVRVPLGYVESLPVLDKATEADLLAQNRARYAARIEEATSVQASGRMPLGAPLTAPPVREPLGSAEVPMAVPQNAVREPHSLQRTASSLGDAAPGRGGQKHKYLQHLIKSLGEERGFVATIEAPALGGRADVALVRGDLRLAFEISVTTGADQEFSNIEKCVAAGYGRVVLVGISVKQVKTLQRFIEANLAEEQRDRVEYLVAEQLVEYLDRYPMTETDEKTVRGYKVRSTRSGSRLDDAEARRKAIANVIARSVVRKDTK